MKVLIAIDDSKCSETAIESVAERTWPEDSEFRIVSVLEPFAHYVFAGAYAVDSMIEAERQAADQCRAYVNAKVSHLLARYGKERVTTIMMEGSVAESIISSAVDFNADLIVIGSHGRRGFQKFLLGSVAEKVVSHAPCSVEVIKSKCVIEAKKAAAEADQAASTSCK